MRDSGRWIPKCWKPPSATLEQLQAESNKTVGIISHVDSMRERIYTQVAAGKTAERVQYNENIPGDQLILPQLRLIITYMQRQEQLKRLKESREWDILVIGGGATGLGIAVDAASRGYSVALVEKEDFAKGTSSRSTKLVHGGVRYLAQGNIKLVIEALRERGILLKNAPHITRKQNFIVPSFKWWEKYYYGIGLGLYDLLAGKLQIGSVNMLSKKKVMMQIPAVKSEGLSGGISYVDGQFDDARLAINLAQTAAEQGACIVNHMEVDSLILDNKKVKGAELYDHINDEGITVRAKVVINATGVFADDIIRMENPEAPAIIESLAGRAYCGGQSILSRHYGPDDPENRRRSCTICRSLA